MKKLLYLPILVALLCSCIPKKQELIILQHPETMDFEECRVADWGSKEAIKENEECVKSYKQQGYTIWGTR